MDERFLVVGTSHVSKNSVNQIKKSISDFKPDIVAVELDINRYRNLFGKSKKRKFNFKIIKQIGIFGFLFLLFGSISQKIIGKRTGSRAGNDMKSAIIYGKKAGAKIALIDQDIRITLNKLSRKVPLREKLKLFTFLFKSNKRTAKFDIKSVPNNKIIKQLISEFKSDFPNIYSCLVKDRDDYMKRQIKILNTKFPESKILIVIGAGHKEKVEKYLENVKIK
ncbi:hypothetical protein CMO95_03135 [Candidatus Woesearchaeota archaeon]|jgi:pheromone shutdown-related protein TraB|nr:hypothetical protein [Candidatus Woesearchaeota archaeon]MBN88563.1 hypothetical protein [Candidatus Woesearchaeota archaeon]|tara:strand:+ start:1070 stop:1735 length:666 start_codon:yes stop_codon:yes gene_type:complete